MLASFKAPALANQRILACATHSAPRACRIRPAAGSYMQMPSSHVRHAACRRRQQSAVVSAMGSGSASGMAPELKAAIDNLIQQNKVVVFIKGTKLFPQCGFSNTVVQIMNSTGTPYESVDILADERLRSGMKEYSQWPTFPQVYIGGEFFGGCDIMLQSYQSGELKEMLERVAME